MAPQEKDIIKSLEQNPKDSTHNQALESLAPTLQSGAKLDSAQTQTLNAALTADGILPNMTIEDGSAHQDADGEMHMHLTGVGTGNDQQAGTDAIYNPETQQLTYNRSSNRGVESVSINMTSGEEAVSYQDKTDGSIKTEIRAQIGASEVTTKQFEFPPGISPAPTVTQEGGVLGYTTPTGERISVVPNSNGSATFTRGNPEDGRSYTLDQNGNVQHIAQKGDCPWNMAQDLQAIVGRDPSDDAAVSQIVQKMADKYAGGDVNNFQLNPGDAMDMTTAELGETVPDLQLKQAAATSPDAVPPLLAGLGASNAGDTFKVGDTTIPTPKQPANYTNVDGGVQYTDSQGNTVTVWKATTGETPLVKTVSQDNLHINYDQGTRHIWTTDGNQYYAKSDNRDTVKVDKPWEQGLQSGFVQSIAANGSIFVLGTGDQPKDANGWEGQDGTDHSNQTPGE